SNFIWYSVNAGGSTHQTGSKAANQLGLKNLSGNVREWCWDRYDDYPLSGMYLDYTGSSTGAARLIRGGAYNQVNSSYCRMATREYDYPFTQNSYTGFRVICP
ncbi:MAG: formylglycine-generating enzyme family protein, partial [Spirochaetaceae bacterium]|nr:formylglycine-generating enzyme family protein [Spirochaetaceae bacterium]